MPGLDGVVAAQTEISLVDGQNGRLVYRGYVIADLAEVMSFEEVAYLLWFGDLPTEAELKDITGKLASHRELTPAASAAIRAMPADADPNDVLRTAVSAQGVSSRLQKPTIEQAIANTASFPTILATFHRQRQGLEPIAPRDDLGHAANYMYMLSGEMPDPDRLQALNSYLVLLADHGMNASTFTARVIASTGSDISSCLTGAIGALKGPLHGGAPSLVIEQLEEVGKPENVDAWARGLLDRHDRFMGFGHVVYRTYDPRARIFKAMAERLNPTFYALASTVEETVLRYLKERYPQRPMATNVEFYSAGILQAAGLPKDLFTPTFAVSRAAGWTAHILEQVAQQAAGKSKIIRPQSQYVGPEPRRPLPLSERGKAPAG